MKEQKNITDFLQTIQEYYQFISSIGTIDFCVYQTNCLTHRAQLFHTQRDREEFLSNNRCKIIHSNIIGSGQEDHFYFTVPYFSGDMDKTIEDHKKSIPSLYKYRFITRLGKKLSHVLFGNAFKISLSEKPLLVESLRQKARKRSVKKLNSIPNTKLINHSLPNQKAADVDSNTVIIIMNSLEQSGAERFALQSIDFLKAKFKNCILLVENISTNRLLDIAEEKYIELNPFPIKQIIPSKYEQDFLVNFITRSRPAYLHIHHSQLAYSCLPNLKAINPNTVTVDTSHLIELPHGGLPSISGHYSNFIDFHHVISKQLQRFLINTFDVDESRCKLGYLYDSNCKENKEKVTDKEQFLITFIGRMVLQKRPYMIVLLANYIKTIDFNLFKTLKFKMVGMGFLLDTCKLFVEQYELEQHFIFIDYLNNSKECLKETDIFILPSENEGIALSCMEAIEESCLVLSCNVGAQSELIPDENLLNLEPSLFLEQAYHQIKLFIQDTTQQKAIIEAQHNNLATLSNNSWISAFKQIYCRTKESNVE